MIKIEKQYATLRERFMISRAAWLTELLFIFSFAYTFPFASSKKKTSPPPQL